MTLSLIAHDTQSGFMGGVTMSHFLAVGGVVLRGASRAGIVVSQCYSEPVLLDPALHRLGRGMSAGRTLDWIHRNAQQAHRIQAGAIDRKGRVAQLKSRACADTENNVRGPDFLVLTNTSTPAAADAMAKHFDRSRDGDTPLAARLLQAAQAAQAKGGDTRGPLAAGLRVVSIRDRNHYGIDLRADLSDTPLDALERQLSRLPDFPL